MAIIKLELSSSDKDKLMTLCEKDVLFTAAKTLTQNGVTKDVVIDTNLNQIWPIANGESYGTLIELLSKSTEKIR